MKKLSLCIGLILPMVLVGCASTPNSLYSWGQYPQQTYLMLNGDAKSSSQQQITTLEADIQKAKAKNAALPPGLYGHLGLLHTYNQNNAKALEYFELEKQAFPESSVLMNRLIAKLTGQKVEGAQP